MAVVILLLKEYNMSCRISYSQKREIHTTNLETIILLFIRKDKIVRVALHFSN